MNIPTKDDKPNKLADVSLSELLVYMKREVQKDKDNVAAMRKNTPQHLETDKHTRQMVPCGPGAVLYQKFHAIQSRATIETNEAYSERYAEVVRRCEELIRDCEQGIEGTSD
jgi:hypothetical protein